FNHGYGKFIAEASFWVEQNNEVASVILLNLFEGKPLITEVFTGKKYYKQGMAGALIITSMNALYNMGYEELYLNVKKENVGAIKLYKDLGFKVVE
ncbi:MAG TPA: GNAT family N-acetyltransferase, partial [Patescibacteria group bacterium]|nr:GNAT family N-acetyltransferase [Patescibacteria group bacterium]